MSDSPAVAGPAEALSSAFRSGTSEGVFPHTDRAPEENSAAEKRVHVRDVGHHVVRTVRWVEPHLIHLQGFVQSLLTVGCFLVHTPFGVLLQPGDVGQWQVPVPRTLPAFIGYL